MCGIVGFCGKENALPFLLDGLEKLEYRGYDSAGVAVLGSEIMAAKAKGRLSCLCEKIVGKGLDGFVGIGHTRWATHGAPTDQNSHPHLSRCKRFAVVHNGIIENYAQIKQFLLDRSFEFASETDTEVIAHLVEYYYQGSAEDAIIKAALRLHGSYALAILCRDTPEKLYAMRKDSPLVIGLGRGAFAASDMSALISETRDFIIPEAGELAILSPNRVDVVNFNREKVEKKQIRADWQQDAAEKNGFEHFMLKEIYEQPRAIESTLADLSSRLPRLKSLVGIKRISIVGCGSALHAGVLAKYLIEKLCRIPTDCEMASEFRYKNPIIEDGTLVVAISQSGETADTIAALQQAKKSARVLSVVNVPGSSVARLSDEVIYTLAGPEIAVATTKGYTSQVVALTKIALFLCRQAFTENFLRGENLSTPADNTQNPLSTSTDNGLKPSPYINESELAKLEADLAGLPAQIERILEQKQVFQQLAARFSYASAAFFIGRGVDYAVAMEGALKLKEISYIGAQSYAAGELKHGTISLIEDGTLVVAISTDPALYEKTISNIREVQSRGAVVLGVTCFDEVAAACDFCIKVSGGLNAPVLSAVALQMFSYYTALVRGCDIDKPRNLAKSVTVE